MIQILIYYNFYKVTLIAVQRYVYKCGNIVVKCIKGRRRKI